MPEVLNKMRQRAVERTGGLIKKDDKDGTKNPVVKGLKSSLVGGGNATLPAGFADTMLAALNDIQSRLATIDRRLDDMDAGPGGDGISEPSSRVATPRPTRPATPRSAPLPGKNPVLRDHRNPALPLSGADAEHWRAAVVRSTPERRRPSLKKSQSEHSDRTSFTTASSRSGRRTKRRGVLKMHSHVAATRLHGISTSRAAASPPPRNVHVARRGVAASTEYPRRGRGVAATPVSTECARRPPRRRVVERATFEVT